jgi:hypothetical protein
MTVMPSWSPGDPETTAHRSTADGVAGPPFRSKLAAVQPGYGPPPEISLRFKIGVVHVVLEPSATASIDHLVDTVGKRLKRRGYSCRPPAPSPVAGYADGRARVVAKKKRLRSPAGEPQLQLYTLVGPFSLMVTVAEAQAGLAHAFGPIIVYPPTPPAITPVVQIPGADTLAVEEKLMLTQGNVRLTGVVSPGLAAMSTDQFALARLESMRSRLPDMAVGDWQSDVFLGGRPCVRHTFVHGGVKAGTTVRSEYWWAGVVADRGIQIFVLGTKSIIDLNQAHQLQNFVMLVPAG